MNTTRQFEPFLRIREDTLEEVGPWYWPSQDTGLWQGPSEEWPHFKERVLRHVKKFDVIVQAGGACGVYPRLYSKFFKNVYTFEPDPLNFLCLTLNTQVFNVKKFNGALGDAPGWVVMNYASPVNVGMHRVAPSSEGSIPMMTIDSFNFYACDFIQLDIEGFEEKALLGAINTIKKFKPTIQTELARGDVQKILIELNYEPVDQWTTDIFWVCKD
jgi:FkbM family methyltransferase